MPAPHDAPAARAGGYPADAHGRLAAVQHGNYWFESRNRLIVWAIRRYFPGASSFLDVGCGTGYVLSGIHQALPGLQLFGTDFHEEGLSIARAQVPEATFFLSDATSLQVAAPVDVAGSFDVLEHIVDDAGALARIGDAIKPGGGLVIAVPQHRWLWSSADDQAQHVRRYTKRDLLRVVDAAGFDVMRTTSFVSLLLPLMALSRWRDARKTKGPSASELVVPPPINAVLRAILTVERACIRLGLSFPAGGSRLVVARKR